MRHESEALARRGDSPPLVVRMMAGGDFAFVRDSAALVFVSQSPWDSGDAEFFYSVARERVWTPGKTPLRPSVVFKEAMIEIAQFGAEALCCDDHYLASVIEVTETHDVEHVRFPSDAPGIAEAFVRVRVLLGAGAIDLSGASDRLIEELKDTTSKPLAGGVISIAHKRKNGSHGDVARAFVSGIYALERAAARGWSEPGGMTGGPRRMARSGRHGQSSADGKFRDLPPKRRGD